jgi:uncharacterized membrane protein
MTQASTTGEPPRVESGGMEPIRHISIATRNRTAALVRAIESYADNLARFGRAGGFWIIDDSDPDHAAANADALARAVRTRACEIHVSGRRHRDALVCELARRTGVRSSLLAFGFTGDVGAGIASYGACRNTMLAGLQRRFVSVDDDTVCRLFWWPTHRHARMTMPCRPAANLCEHAFFGSLDEAVGASTPADQDFLATHDAMLGRPLDSLIAADEDERRSSVRSESWPHAIPDPPLRTALSGLGLLGDCASEWTGYYLFLDRETLTRLGETPAAPARYLQRRQVAIGVPQLTVWDGPPLRGMNLGLNNAADLPPFFPVDRDEDRILSDTLRRVMPEARYALHPLLLLHDPPEARADEDWWARLSLVRPSMVLKVVFQACGDPAPRARSTDAMQALGAEVEAFAAQAAPDFGATVLDRVWTHTMQKLADLRLVGRDHPNLADAVRRIERQVTDVWAVPDAPIRGYHANPARWQRWQAYVGQYGQLLQAWPTVRAAARDLDILGTRTFSAALRKPS